MTDFSKHMRGVNVVPCTAASVMTCNYAPCVRGRNRCRYSGPSAGPPETWHSGPSKLSGLVLDEADEMLRMGFMKTLKPLWRRSRKVIRPLCSRNHAGSDSSHYPPLYERAAGVRIQSSVTTRPDISQSYWTVGVCVKTKHWYVSWKRKILMRDYLRSYQKRDSGSG